MGLQVVDGKTVYVVVLDEMPKLPVQGHGWEGPYAEALTLALVSGLIEPPGKFAIEHDVFRQHWDVYKVLEG